MGRKHKWTAESSAELSQSAGKLTAPSSAIDAALATLFDTSSGPVTAPAVCPATSLQISTLPFEQENVARQAHSSPIKDSFLDQESASLNHPRSGEDDFRLPSKKRRRTELADDIELSYMRRLTEQKARLPDNAHLGEHSAPPYGDEEVRFEGTKPQVSYEPRPTAGDVNRIPQHESLGSPLAMNAAEDSARTVFLGNVSIEAIRSKAAKKLLLNHLSLCLPDGQPTGVPQKVRSLRFRSTAFASGVGPRRAAYAKKELMEETTHATHAYVVYTTQEAAETAAASLNGTVVLDRHLRADLISRPAKIDHRRCVFIGNLGFVDDESIEIEKEGAIIERKRRGKQPADVEEGLWRTFSKAGKVESVRVIRDRTTRVGKGIAYVQFYDENSVEAALLYNDKKFPPLLPRKLRVTRARKPEMTTLPPSRSTNGGKQLKTAGGVGHSMRPKMASPTSTERKRHVSKAHSFVFEGHRATKPVAHSAKSGLKKRKHTTRHITRSSRRGAAFKAAGGKRPRK